MRAGMRQTWGLARTYLLAVAGPVRSRRHNLQLASLLAFIRDAAQRALG